MFLFPHVRSHPYSRAVVRICLCFKGHLRHNTAVKSPITLWAIVVTLSLGALNAVHADSATWSATPLSGDWNTAANWTPMTVPNGPDSSATFDVSNTISVGISADINIGS